MSTIVCNFPIGAKKKTANSDVFFWGIQKEEKKDIGRPEADEGPHMINVYRWIHLLSRE